MLATPKHRPLPKRSSLLSHLCSLRITLFVLILLVNLCIFLSKDHTVAFAIWVDDDAPDDWMLKNTTTQALPTNSTLQNESTTPLSNVSIATNRHKAEKIAILFTTGGSNCSDISKIDFVHTVWDKLVESLHFTLELEPQWQFYVRVTNDGLVPCLNWTTMEHQLMKSRREALVTNRIETNYISIPQGKQGIGQNMNQSYIDIYERNDIDYVVNLEDDLKCRKRWLLDLYEAYQIQKAKLGGDPDIPLIASGYNSNFTSEFILRKQPCSPNCIWKQISYGPNYFFDNSTFHRAVYPAFTPNFQGWEGKKVRPNWAASIDAWDNWVLEEYATAAKQYAKKDIRRKRPPGVLVLSPSVLQHIERQGSLHSGKHDAAIDYMDSMDDPSNNHSDSSLI